MNELKRAIDTDLSGLKATAADRAIILERAWEGRSVKKKLSVAFVLTLVLILAATAALAGVLLSNQYFADVAQLESENGCYENWPLEQKLLLLGLMKKYNVEMDTAEADALLSGEGMTAAEREQRVDAIIVERYGIGDRADVVGLESILTAEKGDKAFWTVEEKAWYIDLLSTLGMLSAEEEQLYVLPGETDMAQAEAEALARQFLKGHAVWAAKADALPAVNFSLVAGTTDAKTWEVTFYDETTDTEIFLRMPSGKGTADDQVCMENQHLWEKCTAPWRKNHQPDAQLQLNRYDALVKQFGVPNVNTWPLEAWNIYLPEQYLLPEETDISPDQAEAVARAALKDKYPDKTGLMDSCTKQLNLTYIDDARMYVLTFYRANGDQAFGCRVNAANGDVILTAYHE